jgi:hypothetical protein
MGTTIDMKSLISKSLKKLKMDASRKTRKEIVYINSMAEALKVLIRFDFFSYESAED